MLLQKISCAFDPVYLKPKVLAGAIRHFVPGSVAGTSVLNQFHRSGQDRRQQDRRQQKQHVLLDLRSSYSRRNQHGRRNHDTTTARTCGINLFA